MNEYEIVIKFGGQVIAVRVRADDYQTALSMLDNVEMEVLELDRPEELQEAA